MDMIQLRELGEYLAEPRHWDVVGPRAGRQVAWDGTGPSLGEWWRFGTVEDA